MGANKPRSQWTEASRKLERKTKRARFRSRYKHNPAYQAEILAKNQAWKDRKIARCPEYARLVWLRSTIFRLREQVDAHQKKLDADFEQLRAYIREAETLAVECHGR